MRNIFEKFNLQLFADSVSGNGAAVEASAGVTPAAAGQDTGVTSAAAGQNGESVTRALESLGVPSAEVEKYRAIKGVKKSTAENTPATAEPVSEPAEGTVQQVAAAEPSVAEENKRLSWDELMKDPEYSRKMSETVQASKKQLQDKLKAIAPALELIGGIVGVDASDVSKVDFAALNQAVLNKDSFYEVGAISSGNDFDSFKNKTRKELEINARERELTDREQQFKDMLLDLGKRSHEEKVVREAAALKQRFPSFDLKKEMQNQQFADMIKPNGGLSVEQAYWALHHQEIEKGLIEQTASQTAQALSRSVQAGRKIPAENGSKGRAANPVGQKKYSELKTPEEKAAFEAWLKNGAQGNFV